jgi:hypothetical protein
MTALLTSIVVSTIIGASCSEQVIDSKAESISETNNVINESNEPNRESNTQFIIGSDLRAHRERFSVITLNDGRIMAIGGKAIGLRNVEMGNFEDSTELLDIATMTWKLTGKMNEKRKSPGVAQLNDQTVITAGGTGAAKVPLNSVEIWNPNTEEWQHTTPMNTARDSMGYVLLPDGRFMVTGGKSIDKKGVLISYIKECEIYDPETEQWIEIAPMHEERVNHTATLLNDGNILVVGGGKEDGPYSKTVELYDIRRDIWILLEPMSVGRAMHTATKLLDGRVLIVGGRGKKTSTEIYDPRNKKWSSSGDTEYPRAEHSAIRLPDGSILITGGIGQLTQVELYSSRVNSWSTISQLSTGRYRHNSIVLDDGTAIVIGGISKDGILASTETLNFSGEIIKLPDISYDSDLYGCNEYEGYAAGNEALNSKESEAVIATATPAVTTASLNLSEPVDQVPGVGTTNVQLAVPVRLTQGKEIVAPDSLQRGIAVEFMYIIEDTRCSDCGDQGQAVIRINLRVPSGPLGESDMILTGDPSTPYVKKFGRYSVVFVSLEPGPGTTIKENPEQAIATLAVIQ